MRHKSFLSLPLVMVFISSCTMEAVKVPASVNLVVLDISASVKIHTDEQNELINSDNPADLINSDWGKDSFSSPLPVTFSWSEENDLNQQASKYILKISELGSMSNSLEYVTKNNSYDVYNLKINYLYCYQVISFHHDKSFPSEIKEFTINESAPRNIRVDGVENVRDLGGWNIGATRFYKQGLIYRTAQFNHGGEGDYNNYVSAPTAEGKNTLLNELKIKTEIDLRRTIDFDNKDEVNGITSSPLGKSVKYVSCPMRYFSANIFTNEKNLDSLRLFFETLADESNYPIAFHCLRGTDRTGALAYVLGAMVGMSNEDLMLDYLFSDLAKINNPVYASTISGSDFYIQGIANSEGSTTSEKAINYVHNTTGVSISTLETIVDILTEEMVY